eukprot:369935-Rhodomonas_salina.1
MPDLSTAHCVGSWGVPIHVLGVRAVGLRGTAILPSAARHCCGVLAAIVARSPTPHTTHTQQHRLQKQQRRRQNSSAASTSRAGSGRSGAAPEKNMRLPAAKIEGKKEEKNSSTAALKCSRAAINSSTAAVYSSTARSRTRAGLRGAGRSG